MGKLATSFKDTVFSVLLCRSQLESQPSFIRRERDAGALVQHEPEKGSTKSLPPTDSYEFWWLTTGEPLARMLEWASYPLRMQHAYVSFYQVSVLPEYSRLRSASRESLKSSITLGESKYFPSYMTDDHTPIELSCVFNAKGTPTVRFSVDPVRRQEVGSEAAITFFEDMANAMPTSSSADLTWCRICAEGLTVVNQKQPLSGEPRYPSQYFGGFELSRTSASLKAYFLPETLALTTGKSKAELISTVVRRLSEDPASSASTAGLQTSWDMLLQFFGSLHSSLTPSIEIVAVDCVPSSVNRLKVYVRTPSITLSNVKRFMTLGSTIESPAITKALEQISYFWEILFPDISDEEEPKVDESRLRHPTGGLLFYYELRGGNLHALPKLYLPVRHLCRDDQEIVNAVEKLYRKTNNIKAMHKYKALFRKSFDHRPLSTRTGIHTYITFAAKRSDVEITTYFNPECFSRENASPTSTLMPSLST